MYHRESQELQTAKIELQAVEAEFDQLSRQLQSFEAQVHTRLGSLLDHLSQLNSETTALDEQLRHIREARLFGTDLLSYLDGAPRPARPLDLNGLPPLGLSSRNGLQSVEGSKSSPSETHVPDIKVLYRQLARRYHPDLARNDPDRIASNEQMKEINQAYDAGDLHALMRLAGMSIPYKLNLGQPAPASDLPSASMTELEQLNHKLHAVRRQISRLSSLTIVKLSLDVKLARHQGRDLLGEMAAELEYKVSRKTAERDYLKSQIWASGKIEAD
jgi:DnaJ domain